jgi:hypothetical protein
MRGPHVCFVASLSLASWLASACLGQAVWLHVATEHHDHQHEHASDPVLPGLHAEDHDAHDHQVSTARAAALSSPRSLAVAQAMVALPVDWSIPRPHELRRATVAPSPRGSPQRHAILLI